MRAFNKGLLPQPLVRRYRAFMHVFTDDSASFGSEEFMCLAAIIARDANWEQFYEDWSALLGKHRLRRMHTTDFLSLGGEYKNLEISRERRWAILEEFMAVIREHVECVLMVSVNKADYKIEFQDILKKMKAEEFLFLRLIKFAHSQMEAWGYYEPVAFIFDDNQKIAPRLYSAWTTIKRHGRVGANWLAGITFADDILMPPLQGADVVACGLTRSRRAGHDIWAPESPFRHLFRTEDGKALAMPVRYEIWDAADFHQHRDEVIESMRCALPQVVPAQWLRIWKA